MDSWIWYDEVGAATGGNGNGAWKEEVYYIHIAQRGTLNAMQSHRVRHQSSQQAGGQK